ncbi:hypothetical protein VP01_2621g4 [Puccinia sorghi]|uniref:Uncharacterized protein n=1 Tax=Puccinia sorghi TaxID=27349 RepID=A0A0L6V698_9BASI|nr:hypothetical protein VP01_2621g4 [Puccinia sorghi]
MTMTKKKVYKIKTLPYCSKNANKFFRALDLCMLRQASLTPATNRKRRICKLPKKEKIMLNFVNPPKGLPIYFYHPDWYHALPDSQQKLIPNVEQVAFLPDATQSLQPKAMRHADEKLSDKSFTRKYWEIIVEPYGLLNEDSPNGSGNKESNNNHNNGGQYSEGKEHNLDHPSPDQSSNKYFEEGEAGDLEDSGISHNEDTDRDEKCTGDRSGDEEDNSDAKMEDASMKSITHGVA